LGLRQVPHGHTIVIDDDGQGDIQVTADGRGFTFTGVTSITVFGGNNRNFVFYTLRGDLQQSENLQVHLRQGGGLFTGLLRGNIGGTTTNGNLTIGLDHGAGNSQALFMDEGDIEAGSSLDYMEDFGGNASGTAKTVTSQVSVEGDVFGTANFNFHTGSNTGFANRETLNFFQSGNNPLGGAGLPGFISGSETVLVSGTTQAPGFIHDSFNFDGTITGRLVVAEVAGSNSASSSLRPSNSLIESFNLTSFSTGGLVPIENNQPHSNGTEELDVLPPGPTFSVVGTIDRAFGSSASTNDPSQVFISNTP
jgi:hypothetical protein